MRRLSGLVRLIFGFIWLVDASYKWRPAFHHHYVALVGIAGKAQPSWLQPWFHFWQLLFSGQSGFFFYGIAVTETYLALAVILGFARKLTYAFGALWSVFIWTIPEGFGRAGVPMVAGIPVVTDIGTSIVYAVVFLAFLALDAQAGTRPYSLDSVIERRVGWWRHIAEVRR